MTGDFSLTGAISLCKPNKRPAVLHILIFRNFLPADLDSLAGLEERAFPVGPYTRGMLRRIFSVPGSFNIIAEDGGKIVAYIIAIPLDGKSADVESIAVDPEYQNSGLGTVLMEKIEATMIERGYRFSILEVRDQNVEAIGFYRKNGYEVVVHLPKYYKEFFRGSRGAYRMKKELLH